MTLGKFIALVILGVAAVMIVTAAITMIAPYVAAGLVVFFFIRLVVKAPGPDPPTSKDPHKPP